MANWNYPTLTSSYSSFVSDINSRLNDLALGLDNSPTNLPEGSIKWSATHSRWEKLIAGDWGPLSLIYDINVTSVSKLAVAQTITLSGEVSGAIAFDGSAPVTLSTTLSSTGIVAGLYGSATQIPKITVDAKGRITNITLEPIGSAGTLVTNNATITGGTISNTDIRIRTAAATVQEGDLKWDATTDTLKIGTGLGIKTFIDTDSIQVLLNKEMSTGSTWHGSPVAIGFGGTGASNEINARANLGLDTMSTQSSSNVNITGGIVNRARVVLPLGTGNSTEGELQWDDVNDLLSIGTASTSKVFVDLNSTQILLNKTINGISLATNPTLGFNISGGLASKTLTIENSFKFTGTDGTTFNLPSSSGALAPTTQQFFLGSTQVAINRGTGVLNLSGVNTDGLAGTATKLAATKQLNGKAFDGSVNVNDIPLSVTNDTTTAGLFYPVFVNSNTGNPAAKVSSTKLWYTPSTGILRSDAFSGNGTNLTDIGTSSLGVDITALSKTVLQGSTTANWRANIAAAAEISTQTIWVPAVAMQAQVTSPPTKVTEENQGLLISSWTFPYNAAKYLQFSVRMPKGWDRGNIKLAFKWSRTNVGANPNTSAQVAWKGGMFALNPDGTAFPPTWVDQTTDPTLQPALYYDSMYESNTTVGATPGVQGLQVIGAGALVYFKITRDTTIQTYAADARLHGIVVTYNTTTLNDV